MPQRACDRCHSIRARCQFEDGQAGCERCLRLGHSCTSFREEKRPGRPRKNTNRRSYDTTNEPQQSEPAGLDDLDPWEVQLAINFLQNQRFENSFVSNSELSNSMQSTPIRLFLSAPGRVKDALLALAGVTISQGDSAPANDADAMASLDRCCKAMERLRQSDVSSVEDAKATLLSATSLISFNDMTLGHGFLPVARAALLSVKPWYQELMNTSPLDTDPHLIPVMFAEVSECVRCAEIPTLRYDISSAQHAIDPSYGVAQELLPSLYDICTLRHDLKVGKINIIEFLNSSVKISGEVETYNMELMLNLAQSGNAPNLSEDRRERILKHAFCYQMMVLLLLRQMRASPRDFTDQDPDYARSIRDTIGNRSTQARRQIDYILFPYFVACTELEDQIEQSQVLHQMQTVSGGIATQSCNRMFRFLQHVWATRKANPTACWLNLVEDGVDFSIGP